MKISFKKKEIKKLREEGYTLREIGAMYGVSKQRIHQILLSPDTNKDA